jgi:hypothetical protein
MWFFEDVDKMRGSVEIIVSRVDTGEIIRHDEDHNQLQDWAKHVFSYLAAGKMFCTLGNRGESVTDVGSTYSVDHYEDGSATNKSSATPFNYVSALSGLVQKRSITSGDEAGSVFIPDNTPLYSFFPSKMRFGTGGLNNAQLPRDDKSTSDTALNNADSTCPFITFDRNALTQHITLSQNSTNTIDAVTFSVKMPGGDSSYPYNGKVISEAGLFCDAGLKIGNDTNMRTGIMFAYRTFKGIAKDESIEIVFNWKISM